MNTWTKKEAVEETLIRELDYVRLSNGRLASSTRTEEVSVSRVGKVWKLVNGGKLRPHRILTTLYLQGLMKDGRPEDQGGATQDSSRNETGQMVPDDRARRGSGTQAESGGAELEENARTSDGRPSTFSSFSTPRVPETDDQGLSREEKHRAGGSSATGILEQDYRVQADATGTYHVERFFKGSWCPVVTTRLWDTVRICTEGKVRAR